jgi:hypothetical protein
MPKQMWPSIPSPRRTSQKNLVGDRYPPGTLEDNKTSQKALSLLSLEAIPSWARGGVLVEWADA